MFQTNRVPCKAGADEADFSQQIRLLRKLEPPTDTEFLLQVGLILGVCASSYFLAGWWVCAIWGFAYVAMQLSEKAVVRLVPSSPTKLQYSLVLCVLFVEASVYCAMPVYLWFLGSDVAKFAALALVTASSMHSMLNRAAFPSILMCFLVPDAAVFVVISMHSIFREGVTAEATLFAICGLAISAFFVVMLSQSYRKEAQSLEMLEQLQQSQKLDVMGKLTGGIAHDFNNLLSVISGNLQLVPGAASRQEAESLTAEALNAAERCSDLTSKLLSFGQKAPLQPIAVSPTKAFEELERYVRRLFPARIALQFDVEPKTDNVFVDPSALQSALLNLALNSAQAITGRGKISISATQDVIAGRKHVRLTVADDGVGISDSNKNQIFDPFFSTSRDGEGSGLGLSMVKGFAEQSQGSVEVDSQSGVGTAISILLPPTSQIPQEDDRQTAGNLNSIRDPQRYSIALVDDNRQLLRAMAIMLEREGYTVTTYENGSDALEAIACKGGFPDLVLTDAVMPGPVQGWNIVQHVKEHAPNVPTIMISGYAASADEYSKQALAQTDAFLSKPIDLVQLASVVKKQLSLKKAGV